MDGQVLKEKWIMHEDMQIEKMKKFDPEIPCLFWVFVYDTGRTHTTMYNNTYNVLEYYFVNKKKKVFNFSRKGWWISRIVDKEKKHWMTNLDFYVVDPEGTWRIIESSGNGLHCIEQAVNLIINCSKYPNWELADIVRERNYCINKIEAFQQTKAYKAIEKKIEKLSSDNNVKHEYIDKYYSYDFYKYWFAYERNFNKSDYSEFFDTNNNAYVHDK